MREWWKIIVPEVNSMPMLNFTKDEIIFYHSRIKEQSTFDLYTAFIDFIVRIVP